MSRKAIILLSLLGWSQFIYAQSDTVVVVLSSKSRPYEEALSGFRESFNQPFVTFDLSKGDPDIPESTRLIVTIGGKATIYPYKQANLPLIYCVAPGIYIDRKKHPGPVMKVYVSPSPAILLQKLQGLQPSLHRLAAFWIEDSAVGYGSALKEESKRAGIDVLVDRLHSLDELPDHLRSLKGRVDAFWLPPDPLLITPQSFSVMRQFALDNDIPLYVSVDGLADKGAAASVSVSFREMGRKSGILAGQLLAGAASPMTAVYGDVTNVTINMTSAAQSGLSISSAVAKKADRVIP